MIIVRRGFNSLSIFYKVASDTLADNDIDGGLPLDAAEVGVQKGILCSYSS